MRVSVGTDIVAVSRFAAVMSQLGAGLLDGTFTPAEQRECGGDPQRLAARWAAKESVLKALGTGVDAIPLRDVEVVRTSSGAPEIRLQGEALRAAAAAGWQQCAVSLAHDGDYATATVVAWAPGTPEVRRPPGS